MNKLLFLSILLLNAISLQAQTINIKGRIVNEQKADVSDATIRCFNNDSILLEGTTSNAKGQFSVNVPYEQEGYKIIISFMGYKDNILQLRANKKDVELGNIVLTENAVNLDDVTVMAKQTIRTNEKIMAFPTKEELRHAADGYGALYNMMLPRLKVDPFNRSVSTREGSTLLCINGREANADEVQNLNPKDIQRVDFYEMGHPNHPSATAVVDYILINREHGGTAVLRGKQNLNRATGTYEATGQFFKRKSEFAVSVFDGYNDFTSNRGNESSTDFKYSDDLVITKEQKGLRSSEKGNNVRAYMNYIYQDKKNQFYASARINRRNADNENNSMQGFSNQQAPLMMNDWRSSVRLNPSGKLFYTRKLKNNQALRITLLASNNTNDYTRRYVAKEGEKEYSTITTDASERYFSISPNITYTKAFRNKGTLTAEVTHVQNRTDSRYDTNGKISDDYLTNGESALYISYQQSFKKLFFRLRWGDTFTYINNGALSDFRHSFTPSVNLSYRITPKQTLNLTASMWTETPRLEWLSTTEQQIDFMQIRKGNPDLKKKKKIDFMLSYTLEKEWGEISLFGASDIIFNDFYEQVYLEQNKFVHTYITGKTFYNLNTGIELKFNLIPKMLTLSLNGEGNHQTTVAWKRLEVSNILGAANLLFMYKGFMASANCVSPMTFLNSGTISKSPFNYNFNFGYNYNGLNVQLMMQNPFSSLAKTTEYSSGQYEVHTKEYTRRISDHIFCATVNYRFSFGKKHKYDNSTMEDTEKSAILKAY